MNPPSPPTEKELFARALELPAAERPDFLERTCEGDATRRARIGALLAAHDTAGAFLENAPEFVRPARVVLFSSADERNGIAFRPCSHSDDTLRA
jgi:hypothetical protein